MKEVINMENQEFYKRLQHLREKNGFTVTEVSRRVGVPLTTYREWEYGRSIRNPENYRKLSEILNVSLYELITGEKQGDEKLLELVNEMEVLLLKFRSFTHAR